MSELAQLFASCETAVPQFEVVERKPTPLEELGSVPDAISEKTKEADVKCQPRTVTNSSSRPTKPRGGKTGARDIRDSRTVFVGNIPSTSTRKQILRIFKTCGKVESVRLRSLQIKEGKLPKKVAARRHKQLTEESTVNAYVVFSSEEEAEKSLKLNGTLLNGRHLRVDLVAKKESTKLKETHLSIFVGNLPFTADEEKLRSCFSDCGDVKSVRIIRDAKTGIGKGFGFVTFSDKSGVMFAMKQNRKIELDGRKLRVFKSKDEQKLKQAKFSGLRTDKVTGKKLTKKHFPSDRMREIMLNKNTVRAREGVKRKAPSKTTTRPVHAGKIT
jgi:nucleolar protein 12